MTIATPSPSEFLVPQFELRVNGNPIPPDAYNFITSVEWEQDWKMVDQLTINLDNTGFQFSDTNLFELGGEVELIGGYKNLMVPMTKGIIERWFPNFPKADKATLEVKAYHPSRELMEEDPKVRRTYKGMTDTEIVRSIINQRGLDFDTTDFEALPPVKRKFNRSKKKDEKDLEFIYRLAKLHNFEFWVDYNPTLKKFEAHFKKYNDSVLEDLPLLYKVGDQQSNIDSVSFEIGLPGQNDQIEVIGWDPVIGRAIRVILEPKKERRKKTTKANEKKFEGLVEDVKKELSTGDRIRETLEGKSFVKVVSGHRFENEKDALEFAERILQDQETAFSEITVNMPGLPHIRNRQVFGVAGLGTRLSGKYYLKTVRHKFMVSDETQYTVEFMGKGVVDTTTIDPTTGKVVS